MNQAVLATLLSFLLTVNAGEAPRDPRAIIRDAPGSATEADVKVVVGRMRTGDDALLAASFMKLTDQARAPILNTKDIPQQVIPHIKVDKKLVDVLGKIKKENWAKNFLPIVEMIHGNKEVGDAHIALGNILNLSGDNNLCANFTNQHLTYFIGDKKFGKVIGAECISKMKDLNGVKVVGYSINAETRAVTERHFFHEPAWAEHTAHLKDDAFSVHCGELHDEVIGHMTLKQVELYCTKPVDNDPKEEERGEKFNWTAVSDKSFKAIRSSLFVNWIKASKTKVRRDQPEVWAKKLSSTIFSMVNADNYDDVSKHMEDSTWTYFTNPQLQVYVNAAEAKDAVGDDKWELCESIQPGVFYYKHGDTKPRKHELKVHGACVGKMTEPTLNAYFNGVANIPDDALKGLDKTRLDHVTCNHKDNSYNGIVAIVKCSASARGNQWVPAVRNMTQNPEDDHPCSLINHDHRMPDLFWQEAAEECLEAVTYEHEIEHIISGKGGDKVHPRLAGHLVTWDRFTDYLDGQPDDKKGIANFPLHAWTQLVASRKFCSNVPAEEWSKNVPESHFLPISNRCAIAVQGKDKIPAERWVKLPADRWTDFDADSVKGLELVIPKLNDKQWGRLSANVKDPKKAFGAAVAASDIQTVKDKKTSGYITPAHIAAANSNLLSQLGNAVYKAMSQKHIESLPADAIEGLTKDQLQGCPHLAYFSAAQIAKVGIKHAKTEQDPIVLFRGILKDSKAREAYKTRAAASGLSVSIGVVTAVAAIVAWIAL